MQINDPFAYITQNGYEPTKWPKHSRLHQDCDDHSLGASDEQLLVIKILNGIVSLQYANASATLYPDSALAQLELKEGDFELTVNYHISRIILPIMRMMRGALALHASCVETSHGATLLMAPSGVGKSTCAAALIAFAGAKMLADDTSLVALNDGQFIVIPSSDFFAMRHNLLDQQTCFQPPQSFTELKHLLPVKPDHLANHPAMVKQIVFLNAYNRKSNSMHRKERLVPEQNIARLLAQQFSFSNAPVPFRIQQFNTYLQLIQQIPVYEQTVDTTSTESLRQFALNFES